MKPLRLPGMRCCIRAGFATTSTFSWPRMAVRIISTRSSGENSGVFSWFKATATSGKTKKPVPVRYRLDAEDTLIADYFPGGHIWPYSEPKRHDTHLKFVDNWFINGMNYWKTLDEWHKRFWASIDRLFPEHLTISEADAWNKYFVLSKTMFLANHGRSYGVGHYLYEKR